MKKHFLRPAWSLCLAAAAIMLTACHAEEKKNDDVDNRQEAVHFPQTGEEIDASLKISDKIAEETEDIIEDFLEKSADGSVDAGAIAKEFEKIENVSSAMPNENGSTIIVKQKDGVHLNVIIVGQAETVKSEIRAKSLDTERIGTARIPDGKFSDYMPDGKDAIILAPFNNTSFDWDKEKNLRLRYPEEEEELLSGIGYDVRVFDNDNADYSKFRGSFLSGFDYISIYTFGSDDCLDAEGKNRGSALITGSTKKSLKNDHFSSSSYLFVVNGTIYYGVGLGVLDCEWSNPFDKAFVHVCAPESYKFAQKFKDGGAGAAIGYYIPKGIWAAYGSILDPTVGGSVNKKMTVNEEFIRTTEASNPILLKGLSIGMSLEEISSVLAGKNNNSYTGWDSFQNKNYRKGFSDFCLFEPHPSNLRAEVEGQSVTLSWELPGTIAEQACALLVDGNEVKYYDDGKRKYSYKLNGVKAGIKHTWEIRNVLQYNDDRIRNYSKSFSTAGEDFTIEAQASFEGWWVKKGSSYGDSYDTYYDISKEDESNYLIRIYKVNSKSRIADPNLYSAAYSDEGGRRMLGFSSNTDITGLTFSGKDQLNAHVVTRSDSKHHDYLLSRTTEPDGIPKLTGNWKATEVSVYKDGKEVDSKDVSDDDMHINVSRYNMEFLQNGKSFTADYYQSDNILHLYNIDKISMFNFTIQGKGEIEIIHLIGMMQLKKTVLNVQFVPKEFEGKNATVRLSFVKQ